MGGDYWVDIDKFAERDLGIDIISYQNNMDYYEQYGRAPIARVEISTVMIIMLMYLTDVAGCSMIFL